MKRITFLMTGLLVLMLACDNPVNVPEDAPDVFRELVDGDLRVAAGIVNAHVYGSFSIPAGGQSGVIMSGPANFPGNPKNAGECEEGLWINPKGKPTSGRIDKPHPHCVGTGITVILEPISVDWGNRGNSSNEYLNFTNDDGGEVKKVGGGGPNEPHTRAEGKLEAYAIDASTLGTTNRRVGILTFDLAQYDINFTNYFEEECDVEPNDESVYTRCLNLVIKADYAPLETGGEGIADDNVTGFLYWKDASDPFNY